MADMTLKDIAEKMKDIDFCMLETKTEGGEIAGRPMSNNREVDYDGDNWFFIDDSARSYADIQRDPKVGLAFQGKAGFLGMRPFFVHIEGDASLVHDKEAFRQHWVKDLERWWPNGIDTPGLALIKIHASRIHYWNGEDEGEVKV